MGQDNTAGRGQTKKWHRLLRRTAGIATGVVVLLLGVLAISVLQIRENDAGGAIPASGAEPVGGIAFARDRDRDGRGELSLINADGSNLRSLPNTIEGDSSLAWSPNGDHFAFVSSRPEGSPAQVYVSQLDSGIVHALSHVPQGAAEPVWSPDGQQIAFGGWGEPVPVSDTVQSGASGPGAPPAGITAVSSQQLYLVNADGTGFRRLSDPTSRGDSAPSWSPDGRQLAFVRNQDGFSPQIWVLDADGANQRQVSHDLRFAQGPLWSPDGRWIAFTGYADEYPAIYLVSPDGSGQHRLLPPGVHSGPPAWSPDGRLIAYLGSSGIFIVNADGSELHRLVDVAGHGFSPLIWSPDGEWIAFTSQPHPGETSGPWELNVVPVDSGVPTPRTIAKDVLQGSWPVWRPVPEFPHDATVPD